MENPKEFVAVNKNSNEKIKSTIIESTKKKK